MRKLFTITMLLLAFQSFAQFAPGNLVIYRVGDGNTKLSTAGTAVFLDEYTPSGTFVKSIPMPTQASGINKPLIASGTALTEGFINRSVDKRYLTVTGYAQELSSSPDKIAYTKSSDINRVIGVIDYMGNINTTTALSDYANGGTSVAGNPRSVISDNGINLWMIGSTGGARYTTIGSNNSIPISSAIDNLRVVSIFNNQLYVSTGTTTATRIGAVGTGLPKNRGQQINDLPGLPTTGKACQFVFFDQDPNIPGLDVLYIADEEYSLMKFSLNTNGQWNSNGIIGSSSDYYRGLTGITIDNVVTLYAIRKGGIINNGSGGELVRLTDASGYNGTFDPTPVVLATAAPNTGFRGLAFAPEAPPVEQIILPVQFSNIKATVISSGIQVSFTNKTESEVKNYTIERSVNAKEFTTVATINPASNNGGEVSYSWIDKANPADIIYYRIKGTEVNGKILYSPIVKVSKAGCKELQVFPNPVQSSQITWETGLPKGIYTLRIINDAGQIVLQQTTNHNGGTISQTINLPSTVKKGIYHLQIVGEGLQAVKPFVVQ